MGGTPRSHHSGHSYQDSETGDGQGEIQLLARRILEFTDGDGDGTMTPNAVSSHVGSHIDSRAESVGGRAECTSAYTTIASACVSGDNQHFERGIQDIMFG